MDLTSSNVKDIEMEVTDTQIKQRFQEFYIESK